MRPGRDHRRCERDRRRACFNNSAAASFHGLCLSSSLSTAFAFAASAAVLLSEYPNTQAELAG